MDSVPALEIRGLTVEIGGRRVIDTVDMIVRPGAVTALVGESGSGKSLTALAVLGLLPDNAVVRSGSVKLAGEEVMGMGAGRLREIRGRKAGIAFQEPSSALDPVMKAGDQVAEALTAHGHSRDEALRKAVELLASVKLRADAAGKYPHELSGGERQRIMLAVAIACSPEVVILDEPTTALDVSVQKHILELIRELQKEKGFAVIFITHDLSVMSAVADDVYVMRAGRIVEYGCRKSILSYPRDPYTRHLLDCVPRLGDTRRRLPSSRGPYEEEKGDGL